MHILNYILNMSDIYLRYYQLGNILEISSTNDFYEISVPVTLPSRCGIYLQYPSYLIYDQYKSSYTCYMKTGHVIYQTYLSTLLVYNRDITNWVISSRYPRQMTSMKFRYQSRYRLGVVYTCNILQNFVEVIYQGYLEDMNQLFISQVYVRHIQDINQYMHSI